LVTFTVFTKGEDVMSVQKVGSEFVVNPDLEGNQTNSSIATDASGNFVIAWEDQFGDGRGYGIRARQFDALGVPRGRSISVNSVAFGNQFKPDIASNADGDFVAVWNNYLPNEEPFQNWVSDISSRRFSSNGTFLSFEDTLNVNTLTTGVQLSSQIAMNAQGDYVIVWDNAQNDQTNPFGIYAQMFSAEGNPIGENIPIATSSNFSQDLPAIAMHDNRSFVVAWKEPSPESGSSVDIYARSYGANGLPLGNPRRVNQMIQGTQRTPAIAPTPDGGFLIAWQGDGEPETDADIFVRKFDAAGVPQTDDISVNTAKLGFQRDPAIAVDSFGNFVVTWEDGASSDIYARRFRTDGTPLSDDILVNTTTAEFQVRPDIAMRPNGDFVITWDNLDDIYAQRFQITSEVVFEQPVSQVNEGSQAILTLNRLNDLHLTAEAQLNVVSGTATNGVDYQFSPQTITFNPGEAQKTITIPILQDSLLEGNETIQLSLTAGDRAFIGEENTATVTILDVLPGQDNDNSSPRPNDGNRLSNRGTQGGDRLQGSNANDRLMGMGGNDTLVGMGGNDILKGGAGIDTLIGVHANARRPGKGEVDRLIGGGGRDLMVLGDADGVFYDDGKANNGGLRDYALIQRFNRKQDTIQLHRDQSDYVLGSAPRGKGTSIFLETGKTDELIALIQGGGRLNLNSSAFEFVG
jgi:hypothetical protein